MLRLLSMQIYNCTFPTVPGDFNIVPHQLVHIDIHTTFGVGVGRDGARSVAEGGYEEGLEGRLLSMQIHNFSVPGVLNIVPYSAIYTPHLGKGWTGTGPGESRRVDMRRLLSMQLYNYTIPKIPGFLNIVPCKRYAHQIWGRV